MTLEGLQPLLRPIAHKGEAPLLASAEVGRWMEIQAREVLKMAVGAAGVVKEALVPRLRRHLPVGMGALLPRLRRHLPVGLAALGRARRLRPTAAPPHRLRERGGSPPHRLRENARWVRHWGVGVAGVVKEAPLKLRALVPRLREPLAAGLATLLPRLLQRLLGLATLLPRLLQRLLVGVQAGRAVAKECITRGGRAGSNLKVGNAQAGLCPHTY